MAAQALRAPFRVGDKQIFLPNFTIALVRQNKLPPNFAKFIVPLNMNKLDLRDYLYHAYNVKVVSVRSYIEQQPVQVGKPNDVKYQRNRWFRPRSIKKMTVELEDPFVFPAKPEDMSPWNQDLYEQAQEENDKYAEVRGRLADAYVDKQERLSMRDQAKALLEKKIQWRPAEEMGRAREP